MISHREEQVDLDQQEYSKVLYNKFIYTGLNLSVPFVMKDISFNPNTEFLISIYM